MLSLSVCAVFVLRVRNRERVREITLVGSHACGEAHEESDVDVLVMVDDLSFDETRNVLAIADDVERAG